MAPPDDPGTEGPTLVAETAGAGVAARSAASRSSVRVASVESGLVPP